MSSFRLIVIALSVQLVAAAAAHEGGHDDKLSDRQYKIGKKGEINIRADSAIGRIVLRKGKYKITHQVNGDQHTFVFTPEAKGSSKEKAPEAIEVETKQLLPSRDKASRFVVYAIPYRHDDRKTDHPDYRISKITVDGENWEHLF
jgi:hypothetical protein